MYRNPFDRLVSAFKDKLEHSHNAPGNPKDDFYFRKYGHKISSQYRKLAAEKFGEEYFAAENNFGAPHADPSLGERNRDYPSFWEFVQFVVHGQANADEHWRPQTAHCPVCSDKPFHYIFSFEKAKEEEFYLKNLIMQHRVKSPGNMPEEDFHNEDVEEEDRKRVKISEDVTKLYLKDISDEDLEKLHNIYRIDFKLLGYEFKFRNKTYN